jgi:hypothetical protein
MALAFLTNSRRAVTSSLTLSKAGAAGYSAGNQYAKGSIR